ncbi:hypothetical protein WN944_024667 [Citrus x changshan-huyou]|uniref:Uncharacterized protein n=1 Tax=Citrus x changshan-huyou TaxID=2935761 RepID=A0AAP0LUN6_9ROSI
MAVGLAITSEGGQYYNGKVTPFVVLSCLVAATGGLIFGYDIGISGVNESFIGLTWCAWHDIGGFDDKCDDQ